jgi:hypothetical protein
MNALLGRSDPDEDTLLKWMAGNKTDAALKIATCDVDFTVPDYIQDAIKK